MPELPEVETTLRGVAPHLIGRTVAEVIVREARLRWPVSREISGLRGQRIERGSRRGKYLLFETGSGTLLIHLGMSGSLRLADPASVWRKHDHVALTLDSGRQIRLHDPRRFGAVLLVAEPEAHPLLAGLGPEPLDPALSADYLHRTSRRRTASAKALIMDSRIVVGVGNIYACEALFEAGIRPSRQAGRLTRPDCARLVDSIRRVLSAAIEMGGTTLRDFVSGTGEPGYFKQRLGVYDRGGEPCRRCGATVRRIVQGQRATFYCPRCQSR